MALTCWYAASGKNAGSAYLALPVVTASHRSCTRLRNATVFVVGSVCVCGRRPAPGSTGSALGAGLGTRVSTGGTVSEGSGEVCDGDMTALADEADGRAGAWVAAAEQPASSTITAASHGARPRAPTSRHLMETNFPVFRPPVNFTIGSAVIAESYLIRARRTPPGSGMP